MQKDLVVIHLLSNGAPVKALILFVMMGIQIVLLIVLGFLLSYLVLLAVLGLFRPRKRSFPTREFRRFAVVVPAHNEEDIIGETLKSLKNLDYPKEALDIIVLADNCNDTTAKIGRDAGVRVLKRVSHFRGKGYALRWGFDRILSRKPGYDAVVVIDADSTVSANFLIIMNHYLEAGAKAVQCSDLVDPQSDGWSAGVTRLSFLLYNFVRPLGRSVIGFPPGLKGNGMCFAADTLRNVPWGSFSLSEDVEYGLELLLKGISTEFAPEASLRAKMPRVADNARSQRVRWESGRLLVIRNYSRRLLGEFIRRKKFMLLDAWIDLVTPSLANMLAFALLMSILNVLAMSFGIEEAEIFVWLWICVISTGILHAIVGFVAAGTTMSDLHSLLHVPRYLLWKAGVYLGLRKSQTKEWVRTHREQYGLH